MNRRNGKGFTTEPFFSRDTACLVLVETSQRRESFDVLLLYADGELTWEGFEISQRRLREYMRGGSSTGLGTGTQVRFVHLWEDAGMEPYWRGKTVAVQRTKYRQMQDAYLRYMGKKNAATKQLQLFHMPEKNLGLAGRRMM